MGIFTQTIEASTPAIPDSGYSKLYPKGTGYYFLGNDGIEYPCGGTVAGSALTGTSLASGIVTSSLTAVGTLATGTWNASLIAGQYGGTGVANTGKTFTIGGNFVTSGAYTVTLTVGANTNVTLPASGTLATLSGAETLTEKTLLKVKDTVYAITDGAAFEIDPANGGIQTITLGANRTPAATNFAAGQSVTLMIDDGTAYAITWTTVAVTWKGNSGAAPTLATTGYTVVTLWKVGTTIYGTWMV